MDGAIVKKVDRILLRVDAPDRMFKIFHEQLLVPMSWPIAANPFFVSGGLHLGNAHLEIIQIAPQSQPLSLYGIGFEFESDDASLDELDQRGILHTPPLPFIYVDSQGWQTIAWNNIFLGGFLNHHLLHRLFFRRSQRTTREQWEKWARPTAGNLRYGLPFLVNTVYRHGMIFGLRYNPNWESGHIHKDPVLTGLEITGVYEITVGVRNVQQAQANWSKLLAPFPEVRDGIWRTPGDLHIRLTPHRKNSLLGMIWQVSSLNRAAQFLHRQNMLGPEVNGMISIRSSELDGLSILLTQ